MRCRDLIRRLTEDLSAGHDPQVRSHFDQCGPCRRFYEELCSLEELNRSLAESTRAPKDFSARVMRGVRLRRLLRYALPAAAALLLAVLAPFVLRAGLSTWEGTEKAALSVMDGFQKDPSGPTQGDSSYLEFVVQDASESELIIRVPSTIEVRLTDPIEEYPYRHVSY